MRYLYFLFCLPLYGALSVTVTSVTQTQALFQEQGFSGPCTIAVSSSPSLSPLHPDVSTEYPGSSIDTSRGDTIISADGATRTVTIGHMNDDRALANFTTYYYQVSGCGATVTGNFVTANLSIGTTRSEQTPFNASKWGNLGLPAFDWATKKSYVDPLTGATLIPMATSIQTWRTGCGASGCSPGQYRAFTDWEGGNGWTNPVGILAGSATNASTGNTNPLDLYADLNANNSDPIPYDWHRTLEDIGIVVWGSGTSSTAADRVIDLCIFFNPTSGCVSNTIQVTLPTGSVAHVSAAGSTDPDRTFPAAFPSSPFFGWTGKTTSPLIPNERREAYGAVAISGKTLSLGNASLQGFFSDKLAAGNRIWISGSSCGTDHVCTISAAPANSGSVTVNETPGDTPTTTGAIGAYVSDLYLASVPRGIGVGSGVIVAGAGAGGGDLGGDITSINGTHLTISTQCQTAVSGARVTFKIPFRAYGWGIRVWKDNANGTAKIGLKFKLAGSGAPIGVQPGGDKCSSVQVTSGDGKPGYLCSITSEVTGFGWLAFIATDGTTRILSYRSNFSFDDTQGNVFYSGSTNSSGGRTVLKYTYTGNYTTELNYKYTCAPAGDCPGFADQITSTDLMPHSSKADLNQQIQANQGGALPAYNSSIYGDWTASNGAVAYEGSSGHFAFFCNIYAGQGQPTSGGPGWCATIDLSQSPAKVVRLIHTLDGTGAPNARFGSLHSPQSIESRPNTLFLSLDGLDANSTSTLHGGPFQAPVLSVLQNDGVTWNSNTCLSWPPAAIMPCFVQSSTGTGSATASAVLKINPYVGDSILVGCLSEGGSSPCTASDNQGNTYQSVVFQGTNPATTILCAPVVTSGGSFTVTVSTTGASRISALVDEYSNIGSCTPDNTSTSSGTGASLSAGNVTVTHPNSLVFAVGRSNGGGKTGTSWKPGYLYGLRASTANTTAQEIGMSEEQIFPSVGSYNPAGTFSASDAWQMVGAAFRPVSSGTLYYSTCPSGSAPYTDCVTFRLPQGGVCNNAATAVEKSTWPCPWNAKYSQFPLMRAGDNAFDAAVNGWIDSEHFHILSVSPDAGNTLRVVAARNGTYDYCSINPWHGQTNPLSVDGYYQFEHVNGWTLTMMPGTFNSCGSSVLLQDQVSGNVQELGHSFSGHFQIGKSPNGINFITGANTIYNTQFANLQQIPPVLNSSGTYFHGIGRGQLQSYTDDSQWTAGSAGAPWALDMDAFVDWFSRSSTLITGSIYKIQAGGSATASNATYKIQPMIGWSGRYQLKDVSGPSSSVDATPFSMCFAILAGECHAGSSANDIYANLPGADNAGLCYQGSELGQVPCIIFGNNAPGGGLRQFGIYTNDPTGSHSRFITNGWSSQGRQWSYTHGTAYPTGQWAMLMGSNSIDGFGMTGFMVSLPPWEEKKDPNNDFKSFMVKIPAGPKYAEVQFGYSRYIGPGNLPTNGLYCTSRAENCNTSAASLFNFDSEPRTLTECTSGCTITIPAVAPNVMYYRVRRSADGTTWTDEDAKAVALP